MNDLINILKKTSAFSAKSGWKTNPQEIDISILKRVHNFDISIITSTIDEFEELQNQLGNLEEYETDLDDSTLYYSCKLETARGVVSIIVPYPIAMGIEGSVCNTTKIINSFHPQYLFMIGVCAGNSNITNIGDLVIAEKSLNYNSIVEIEKSDGTTRKKYMQNADGINKNLKSKLSRFFSIDLLKSIKDSNPKHELFEKDLKKHIGLMVTGSSLLRSDEKIKDINESYHNVKGLDMETNGFYFTSTHSANTTPHFVSIKGVSDYGDTAKHKIKSNDRKDYALFNSVNGTIHFIKKEVIIK